MITGSQLSENFNANRSTHCIQDNKHEKITKYGRIEYTKFEVSGKIKLLLALVARVFCNGCAVPSTVRLCQE